MCMLCRLKKGNKRKKKCMKYSSVQPKNLKVSVTFTVLCYKNLIRKYFDT